LNSNGLIIKKSSFIFKKTTDIREEYDFDPKKIGSGTYGTVFRAVHKTTGIARAAKIVPKNRIKDKDRFTIEVDILKRLDHPNVIKLFEIFEDDKNVYLIMELCTGGELFDRITECGSFTEKYAAKIFKQILLAIKYCHQNNVCHRDLKPENFLFESKEGDNLKIIDFGLSKIFSDPKIGLTRMKTRAGTPYYISPEVIAGNYTYTCDLWSAGVILYILLCGYPPFFGNDDQEILRCVQRAKLDFEEEEWELVSDEAKDLIRKLIAKPEVRYSGEEALNHPWIKNQAPNQKAEVTGPNIKMLRSFQNSQRLRKVALTYIAAQCSTSEIEELRKVFQMIDTDGDGTITLSELKVALSEIKSPDEVRKLMESIDTNQDGSINYTEYLAASIEKNLYMQEKKLRNTFKSLDIDGSGKISANELRQILSDEIDMEDEGVWSSIIKEVDIDGDGEIDYEEFIKMMASAIA